jgi:hypothetical protein
MADQTQNKAKIGRGIPGDDSATPDDDDSQWSNSQYPPSTILLANLTPAQIAHSPPP